MHCNRHGARDVRRDIRLQEQAGERVALVGSSGNGKSTLLRLVAGLDRDFEGQVRLAGRAMQRPTREVRFVFQEPRLFPWFTVARNVAFNLDGRGDDARVQCLLAEVGLAGLGDRLPKQLSGGQAQRVALARGLFVQPRLPLLHEPFSAVDAFTRERVQQLLHRLAQAHGITVLLVTHDIAETVQLSDRVLVLVAEPGRVAATLPLSQRWPRKPEAPAMVAAVQAVRDALRAVHAL